MINTLLSSEFTIFTLPLILTCLSLASALVVFITYTKFIKLRIQRGILILFPTICEAIFHILIGLSLFYTVDYGGGTTTTYGSQFTLKEKGFGCQFLGTISTYFMIIYIGYNFFNIQNLYCSKYSGLNSLQKRFKIYLIIANIIAATVCILAYEQNIGYIAIGCCSLKSSDYFIMVYCVLIIILVVSVFALIDIVLYHKKMDKNNIIESKYEKESRHEFVNQSLLYAICFIITWTPFNITMIITSFYDENNRDNLENVINYISIISLNFLTAGSIGMLFAKINIFALRKYLKPTISISSSQEKLLACDQNLISIESNRENETLASSQNDSKIAVWNNSNLKKSNLAKSQKSSYKLNKTEIINSLIITRYFFHNTISEKNSDDWEHHHYTQCSIEQINTNEILSKEELDTLKFKLKDEIIYEQIYCINYATTAFRHLATLWHLDQDEILKSLSLMDNIEQLSYLSLKSFKKYGKNIVYSTSDQSLILRTLNKTSKFFLTEKFLPKYHAYCIQNQNTALPRLLGLFALKFKDNSYNLLLLQNKYKIIYGDKLLNAIADNKTNYSKFVLSYNQITAQEFDDNGNILKLNKFSLPNKSLIKMINFKNGQRQKLIEALLKDIKFLSQCQITHYKIIFYIYGSSNDQLNDEKQYESDDRKRILASIEMDFDGEDKKTKTKLNTISNFSVENPYNYQIMMEEYLNQYI